LYLSKNYATNLDVVEWHSSSEHRIANIVTFNERERNSREK